MAEHSVLIIDDDIWMQRILSKTLQSYGFKITYLASNGFDGIALAVEHTPSLIILDILMPELSGHLTLKILKHIKTTKEIPVLMVSALSDVENLGMAVKSGTAAFISKPFTRATVYDKLVDIFGKEELDLISKGEAKPEREFEEEDVLSTRTKKTPEEMLRNRPEKEEKEEDTDRKKSQRAKIPQDKLLQHYQDDEKKSIESIKKLLLKSRR